MTCCKDPFYSIDRGRIDSFALAEENIVGEENSIDETDCKPSATPALSKQMSFDMKKEHSFKIQQPRSITIEKQLTWKAQNGTPASTVEIEIYPGHFLPLRGAQETSEAIRCDFYMPTYCAICSLTLFCIRDAKYVICPMCRVVHLMEDDNSGGAREDEGGGVGLGFTLQDLAKWQTARF